MKILKNLKDFLENEKIEETIRKRDEKLNTLIKYKDCTQYSIFGYNFYINEKLGYNSSLVNYINIIIEKIEKRKSDNLIFDLDIDQLSINKIKLKITEDDTHIIKNNLTLELNIGTDKLDDLRSTLNHELHHIFINSKGNKTNNKYFIVNDLIKNTSGKTHAFLLLYYLSFKDEVNSNIQMFHSIIGENNIKNREEFLKFLNNNDLYNVAIKMKNIDVFKYWREIVKEGYSDLLIEELGIDDITIFLNNISKIIIKSGNEYIHKLSRAFI